MEKIVTLEEALKIMKSGWQSIMILLPVMKAV